MRSSFEPAQLEQRFRSQLLDRRVRLETSIATLGRPSDLLRLLTEVDAALSRVESGSYGECEICHGEVEPEDLQANPTAVYCLCELTPERQQALQRDLDLAWRVQAGLLPVPGLALAGWQSHYRYIPNGPVSGDHCDLIAAHGNEPELYFMLGDVSGKGVAASLLMAHLNASLRSFARMGLSPREILEEANRLLSASTLASHYATLVCGRAYCCSGEVEIVNAGHCPPLIVRANGRVEPVETAGLPLGLAVPATPAARYTTEKLTVEPGECVVLYTDGFTEAANAAGLEYGAERLRATLARHRQEAPRELVASCLDDLSTFLDGSSLNDDLAILALARGSGKSA
jgi:sigma-B regulation protein RsbU (phosphoserine phosphatase)